MVAFVIVGGDNLPSKPKKPCAYPGCPALVTGRYCEEHAAKRNSEYEKYGRDKDTKEYRYLTAITPYDDFSYCQQAIRMQITDYILKPVDYEEFGNCIDNLKISMFEKK